MENYSCIQTWNLTTKKQHFQSFVDFLYFLFKVNFAYVEHGEKKNTLIKLSMYDRDLFPLFLTLFGTSCIIGHIS